MPAGLNYHAPRRCRERARPRLGLAVMDGQASRGPALRSATRSSGVSCSTGCMPVRGVSLRRRLVDESDLFLLQAGLRRLALFGCALAVGVGGLVVVFAI